MTIWSNAETILPYTHVGWALHLVQLPTEVYMSISKPSHMAYAMHAGESSQWVVIHFPQMPAWACQNVYLLACLNSGRFGTGHSWMISTCSRCRWFGHTNRQTWPIIVNTHTRLTWLTKNDCLLKASLRFISMHEGWTLSKTVRVHQ